MAELDPMEAMINWIISLDGAQQHVSLALTGSLFRELVKRGLLTLDDAKTLIERTRREFDTYGADIESDRLRKEVRSQVTSGFDRVLEKLEAP